jgi:streptomycin 6-kinase
VDPLSIPEGLEWWRAEPGGADWLQRLPRLVAEVTERWSLDVEQPCPDTHIGLVLPAVRAGGTRVVLKLNFPEPETEHEADALAHWAGQGAVRLLEHDPGRRALLLERCEPGTQLWTLGEEQATSVAADVLRALWRPAPQTHGFRLLADEAARWAEQLPQRWERQGRPFERELLDAAVEWARELGADQGQQVVVHQDFHGGNVLLSGRGWLAIDPKPLVGEREFDLASYLRDRRDELERDPAAAARVRRRLDQLTEELGLDRERARAWGVVHALAWGVADDRLDPRHLACARGLLHA